MQYLNQWLLNQQTCFKQFDSILLGNEVQFNW